MAADSTTLAPITLSLPSGLPALISTTGERTAWRFVEFFTATIRNTNTREAYARPGGRFLAWCEGRGIRDLRAFTPVVVAAYIEQLPGAKPTVKQHLAAIRQCLGWLVTDGALETNPAAAVRGPAYVIKKGKTPVLDMEQTRALLDAIDTSTIVGLRDRALIGVMVYSTAEEFMDAYVKAAGIAADLKGPLFPTVNRARQLTQRPMHRNDAIRMIKRRGRGATCRPASAAIRSGPPASPPISRTGARSSMPRRSPPTSRRAPPRSMTAPATPSRSTRSSGF
jgi:integrase/recombinase XerD